MPVTVKIAKHGANQWRGWKANAKEDFLPHAESSKSRSVIQCSISPEECSQKHITPSENGLVWAAHLAYSGHYHLTLRPEDIWFAIISQLSFYINAHAEELRSMFVAHEGRKQLMVHTSGSIHTVDFGEIAKCLSNMIQDDVTRPDLQAWIVPSFSTTTDSDRAVASVLFMGAMQKYYSYGCSISCGIPSVTLLGEREDWENILKRLDVLPEFGEEPNKFAALLRPILRNLIGTFDASPTSSVNDFWGRIANRISGFSGPSYLSGWITAFCFWDADGKLLYRQKGPAEPLSSGFDAEEIDFDVEEIGFDVEEMGFAGEEELSKKKVDDDDIYHEVDFRDIPNGYCSVPFTINDNGTQYLTQLVAGSFGMEAFNQQKVGSKVDADPTHNEKNDVGPTASNEGAVAKEDDARLDSIKPLTGWMLYHTDEFEDGHIEDLQFVSDDSTDRVDRSLD